MIHGWTVLRRRAVAVFYLADVTVGGGAGLEEVHPIGLCELERMVDVVGKGQSKMLLKSRSQASLFQVVGIITSCSKSHNDGIRPQPADLSQRIILKPDGQLTTSADCWVGLTHISKNIETNHVTTWTR